MIKPLIISSLLLFSCTAPIYRYPKGSVVKFTLKHSDSLHVSQYNKFQSNIYELLDMYSQEKNDFTYLKDSTNANYDFALSVRIGSTHLIDFQAQNKKYQEAGKILDKSAEDKMAGNVSGTQAAIMGASIALSPLTGIILIPTGSDNLDYKSAKKVREATSCSNMAVDVTLERYPSKTTIYKLQGVIQNCAMEPQNENQQISQLLSILQQSIRDSVPFFRVKE